MPPPDMDPPQTGSEAHKKRRKPILFEFVLLENVSMLSVTSAIEPLRVANRIAGFTCYTWSIVSEDGAPVLASNGLVIASAGRIGDGPIPAYTFICAGLSLEAKHPTRLSAFLSRRHSAGVTLGAISMGTIFLARAGLLNTAKCTIHWEGLPAFREEFPHINVTHAIYETDQNILSCSGGMSSFDLIMTLIARDHDRLVLQSIANQLQLDRIRSDVFLQSAGSTQLPETAPRQLRQAVAIIQDNLEHPMSPADLSAAIGASRRTLERMFLKYTGMTPSKFCKLQRLERAKDLLLHSNLAILDISVATGFRSASYFSYSFSEHFGASPSAVRLGSAGPPKA